MAELYGQYSKGRMTEEELMLKAANLVSELGDRYAANIPVLQRMMNVVSDSIKDAGFDLKQVENERQGTKGLAASMTQDQATEMSGFLNNGLIFWHDISGNTKLIYELLESRNQPNSAELLRNHAQNMLAHLASIDRNTKYCERLESMDRNLSNMSAGIDDMRTRGVLMKKAI
jgi:hypothetical protein